MQTLSLILCSAAFTAVLPADFWWLDNNVFGGGDQVGAPNPGINPRNNQRNQKNNRRNKNQRNRNNKSYGNADNNGDQNSVKADNNKAQAAGTACNKGTKMSSCGGGGQAKQSQNNKSGSPALPVTQGLGSASQSQCPDVSAMPPVSSCSSAESNCWSVGEPDWDCPDNGLCCFDGCANTCLGSSKPPSEQKSDQNPPPPVPEKQTQSQAGNSPSIGGGLLFPPPEVGYSQPDGDKTDQSAPPPPSPAPSQSPSQARAPQSPSSRPAAPAAPAPQTQSSPSRPRPSNVAQSQQSPNSGGSESKPYVRCPSAMECVQKTSCDFEGFITEEEFVITPDLEMLRVPLIPCVNRARDNAIDVCCRDPNYEDPWPDHDGGAAGHGGKTGASGGKSGASSQPRPQQQGGNINNAASQQSQPLPNNPKKTKKRKNGYG